MIPRARGGRRRDAGAAGRATLPDEGRPLLTWADRLTRGGDGAQGHARIDGANGFRMTVPLDCDATFEIPGPLGETIAEVEGGSIRIISSPCPHKMCVAMGAIDGPNEMIACVPNQVVVTIPGSGGGTTDAVTR